MCLGGLAAAAAANARERKRKTDEKNGKKGRVGSFWGTVGQPIHHPYTTAQNVASSEAEQSTHHRCLPPPPFNFSHATHGHTHRSYTLKTTRSTGGTGNYIFARMSPNEQRQRLKDAGQALRGETGSFKPRSGREHGQQKWRPFG